VCDLLWWFDRVGDIDLQLVLGRMAWYVAAGRLAAVVAGPLTGAKLVCVSMHVVRKQTW